MNNKKFKEKLKTQKSKLETMLQKFAKEDDKPEGDWDSVFPDFTKKLEESADEVEEYASLRSVEHSLELRLKRTNEALEKIKKGTYGKCEKCKSQISEERLDLVPEAKLCKDCN
jgi:RNA polymerase-binding transcription factor DksA